MTVDNNVFNSQINRLAQIIDPYKKDAKGNDNDIKINLSKIKLFKESFIEKFWKKIETFKVHSIERRAMKITWLNGIEQKDVSNLFTGVDTKNELSENITRHLESLPASIRNRTTFSEVAILFENGNYKEGFKALHRATFIGFALERLNKKKNKDQLFTELELEQISAFSEERIDLYDTKSFKEIEYLINKMDAYKSILSIEDSTTLKNLIFELKNNNEAEFHKVLTDYLGKKMAVRKTKYQTDKNSNGLSLKYFYYKELYSAFRKERKNPFGALAAIHRTNRPYKKINAQLDQIISSMDEMKKNSELDNFHSELKLLRKKLITAINFDYANRPHLDYEFITQAGNISEKFTILNDLIAKIKGENLHQECHCHFSHENGKDKTEIANLPSQQVDVVRTRNRLQQCLKDIEKEIADKGELPELTVRKERCEQDLKLQNKILNNNSNVDLDNLSPLKKRKILVLTCSFGTGHNTAAQAVAKYFGTRTHVSIADLTTDVLLPNQFLYKLGRLFGKKWNDTLPFNYMLKKQIYWVEPIWRNINLFVRKIFRLGGHPGISAENRGNDSASKALLRKRFLLEKPDHIVTVYHMDLNPVTEVAEELGIPVIHLPTDYNVKAREPFGDHAPENNYFKMFLPAKLEKVENTANYLDKEQYVVGGGYPIRPEFFIETSEKKLKQLREERGIDKDTKVVVIMSGGNGQHLPFPELLANSKTQKEKLHVIMVIGGNNAFGKHLESNLTKERIVKSTASQILKGTNENVTIEVARDPATGSDTKPYYIGAKTLSEFMDLADVAVTKPGGASTAEIVNKGTPVLFDHRKKVFWWEGENIDLVKEEGRGDDTTDLKDFENNINETIKIGKVKKEDNPFSLDTGKNLCREVSDHINRMDNDNIMLEKRREHWRGKVYA